MEIRPFRTSDRAGLAAFWKSAFPDEPPHNEPNRVIDAKLKVDNLIFIATDGGAGYDGHRGWLYAVAVDEATRRKGVGTQLVHHVLEALGNLGCIKINLQVRSTNSAVVAFYESLGFKVEDRISMGLLRPKDAQQGVPAAGLTLRARPAAEHRR